VRGASGLPGAEARVVPERERALGGVGGQVAAEPVLLRRARVAAADLRAVRVDLDHVPGAEVEGVVALAAVARWSGLLADPVEVVEVARGARDVVLVVADGRMVQRVVQAPAGRVDLL